MSSTSNVQDLLVNVFRPTYRYDSNVGFVPSLVLSNVSEVITDRLRTGAFTVSDSNRNTFIGESAGANASSCVENVALGYSAMAGAVSSSNNTSFGYSNFVGLSNANSNVGIGANVGMGRGMKNILIGPNVTLGDGSGNIIIGSDISVGNVSKRLQLGTLLYGDLSSGFFGVNTSAPTAAFDISGTTVFRGKVGFQNPDPVYSLDVNGSVYANGRFFGGAGTAVEPLFSFVDASATGMYVPSGALGYGAGSFGIATNGEPTAIFASNSVYFLRSLDVSGTFSASNVAFAAFSVQNGSASSPTMNFLQDVTTGLYLDTSAVLGVSTGGVRRMLVLANGDVSMGRLLASDISVSGGIFSSSGSNNIGGVTLSNGNVILTGVATNTNLLVPGWFRDTDPATNLDISGGNISNSGLTRSSNFRGSNGTAGRPTYSFVSDPSTGLHLVNGSALGFDTSGVLRMCISGGNVGIGTSRPVVALEVVGDVSAVTYNGPGGTEGAPHYTFSDDRTTGVFFPGTNIVGLTAGGLERMRISNANVGIGTKAPANALDVSGTLRVIGTAGDITLTNGAISIAGTPVISSTGVLSNASTTSNSIGGVTLSNSNVIVGGFIRNALTPSTLDISDGNISNSGLTRSGAGFRANNGLLRAPSYTFFEDPSAGLYRPAANTVGITVAGVERALFSNTQTIFNNDAIAFSNSGIRSLVISNNVLLPNNGLVGTPSYTFFEDTTTGLYRPVANSVAVTVAGTEQARFSNNQVAISNTLVAPVLRNALTPSQHDISSGNISNSGLTRSSNFRGSNGTVAVPTYSFANDPSTGLHLAGTSYLGFDTAGVQRMCISGGNVGIGTAAPTSLLDLSGGGINLWGIVDNNTARPALTTTFNGPAPAYEIRARTFNGGDGFLRIRTGQTALVTYIDLTGFSLCNDMNQNIVFGTNSLERMRIDLSGRVGIGTAAPAAILDISIADATGVVIRNSGLTLSNQTAYGSLKIRGNATQNMAYIEDAGGATYNGWMLGTDSGTLGSATRFGLHRITGGGAVFSALAIDACSGYIGIGTQIATNPANGPRGPLDVWGKDGGIVVNRVGNLLGNTDTSAIVEGSANSGMYWHKGDNNNFCGVSFKTLCNAVLAERMRIDANTGNVGIGTTAPSQTLDVSGIIRTFDDGNDVMGLFDARNGNYLRIGAWNRAGATSKNIALNLNGGNVGIGRVPTTYALEVNGDASKTTSGSWLANSDARIKQDIEKADTSLCYSIVKTLPLRRFTWDPSYHPMTLDRRVVGWVSQEVEQIFPRAVLKVNEFGFDDFRYLDVDQIYKTMYGALEKVIADKETLETKVASLETTVSQQATLIETILTRLTALEASQQSSESTQTTPPTPPQPEAPQES